MTLLFVNAFQGSVPDRCRKLPLQPLQHCLNRQHQANTLEITATPIVGTANARLAVAAVPEPSTGALMALGLLAMATRLRLRALRALSASA